MPKESDEARSKVSSGSSKASAQAGSGRAGALAVLVGAAILIGGYLLSQEQQITIFVVSLDTTRPDHLTAYGYARETTPTLERLAREGTRFVNARSTTSWTLPSHMSLFTGLPADLHNVTIDFQRLDLGWKTMGEIFSEAGFHTVGLFTAPYLHERFGFDRGMDFYEAMTQSPMAYDLPERTIDQKMGVLELASHREVTTPRVMNRVNKYFLPRRKAPKNFYFLHLFDPHYDYLPPPQVAQRFVDPTYTGPIDGLGVTQQPEVIHPDMPSADLERLKDLYDAEIRFVDDNLSRLVRTIEDEGLLGSALIVVTGDHGEEFFEAGRIGHRMTLRDEVLRIPLLIWGPGLVPEGRVIDDEVALYDVLPTLMDYADLEPEPTIYGRSLRPLIEGRTLPSRPTHSALTFLHRDGPPFYTRHDALVHNGMKYIQRVRVPWSPLDPTRIDNTPDLSTLEVEVYDLVADPGELTDLADRTDDPRVAGIRQEFRAEQDRQRAALAAFNPLGTPAGDDRVPEDMEQMNRWLRALGYAGTEDSSASVGTAPAPGGQEAAESGAGQQPASDTDG